MEHVLFAKKTHWNCTNHFELLFVCIYVGDIHW